MSGNRMSADELGALRVFVHTMPESQGMGTLRLRCISCERMDWGLDQVDKPARIHTPLDCPPWDIRATIAVEPGIYPWIRFKDGGGCVVLPFDLSAWLGHLLHDVRAEWNGYAILLRPLRVHDWPHETRDKFDLWVIR